MQATGEAGPDSSEFDHHGTVFAGSWRDQLATLRDTCPVARTTAHGGYVVVTRFADATAVLRDPTTFSADRTVVGPMGTTVQGGVTIPRNPVRMGMMEMDPPQHTAYRKLMAPRFSARAVEAWVPRLGVLVDWTLDRVCAGGVMDVVQDISHVLPGIVILDVLGLPLDRYEPYAAALGGAAYYQKGSVAALRALMADLSALVRAERATPVPGSFLTQLLAAEVDGAPLPDDMAVELLFMLLNGGFDTSSALIAHMVLHLDAHDADRAKLMADRTLVPSAVDEMLRYYSPATGVARTTVRDIVIGDLSVRAGERILVALGSANNDPAKFPDADRFHLDRSPNPQISFGSGVHRCIGAVLAREELVMLLNRLLDRMPDLTVEGGSVEAHPTSPLVNGYRRIVARFTAGRRVLDETQDGLPPPRAMDPACSAGRLP